MALRGKRVARVEINAIGDVFHELWKGNPHQIPNISPTNIQNCQTHHGEVGTVGSILAWNYFHDRKDRVSKTLIHDINEEDKLITFHVTEGDVLELYKDFVVHLHVDTKGSRHIVTWTVEYEKLSPDIPDPDTLMEFYTNLTKDIEAHHTK
ncbi:kirola-like [Cynara cardunculus var. scolymus]|uniref:Bet v I domain-containing protein n=1 Tax=Cynara cardunculus var. scolymus TaxID=59895 RepID=A0A103XST9_CYNCS|nr:kirola-like [Cynara cardunculus var. scolymus]KVH96242.1 Bet v I domain-containing protein [Cynara cardunculus var. scolymus]